MQRSKPGVQERILLHLSDYTDFDDSVEVPFALSQMGIANAVSIARSNVPRAIAGLRDDGLLIERQAHVTGVTRKRKSYFLTIKGKAWVENQWKALGALRLRCILQDGSVVETSLAEVKDVLPFQMRPVDVLRYLDDAFVLDLRSLSEDLVARDLSKHVEKQLVTVLGDLPRVRHFHGREQELNDMVSMLDARPTTLIVPGIAGIGKTTMAGKLTERFQHRRNMIYHRCQDWDGVRSFLEAMADWFARIGDGTLVDLLDASPSPRPQDAVRVMQDALARGPCLIVIDDFHKVRDPLLLKIVQGLALAINTLEGEVGLVIFSRSYRAHIPMRDAEGRIIAIPMELRGLDQDASRALLTGFDDLPDDEFRYIYGLAKGHPLVLELINRSTNTGAYHETLENYVSVEIISRLSAEQRRLLGALSIHREPVQLRALALLELDTDELDALVEQGLARLMDGETYDVHDLIREFLLLDMDDVTRRDLHIKAAGWYERSSDRPEALVERLHHLVAADRNDAAAQLLEHAGMNLIRAGHLEVEPILATIDLNGLDAGTSSMILRLRGDILALTGRLEESEEILSRSLSLASSARISGLEAELLSSLADLAMKRGRSEDALDLHVRALSRAKKVDDVQLAARTYNNMGYIFRRKRDQQRAMDAYGEVEGLIENHDGHDLLNARITLARAFIEMGEIDRARRHALEAYEEAESSGNAILLARSGAVLGRYYARTEDPSLALHHYTSALEIMQDVGEPVGVVEITMLLGEVLEDSGRNEEALEKYREGLVLAEASDLRLQIGELLTRLGGMAPDHTRRMEYLQRALRVFNELGARGRSNEVQMMVHAAIMGR